MLGTRFLWFGRRDGFGLNFQWRFDFLNVLFGDGVEGTEFAGSSLAQAKAGVLKDVNDVGPAESGDCGAVQKPA